MPFLRNFWPLDVAEVFCHLLHHACAFEAVIVLHVHVHGHPHAFSLLGAPLVEAEVEVFPLRFRWPSVVTLELLGRVEAVVRPLVQFSALRCVLPIAKLANHLHVFRYTALVSKPLWQHLDVVPSTVRLAKRFLLVGLIHSLCHGVLVCLYSHLQALFQCHLRCHTLRASDAIPEVLVWQLLLSQTRVDVHHTNRLRDFSILLLACRCAR
mmetsp:Transcript_33225/g.75684  ORF Transcript_33225/g.75684 Transcript_33225/m.75684 type:complete len:210 (-) Transcript_33225:359-988(-)